MSDIFGKLRPIFQPESIAVLGASDQPGKWGYVMVDRPMKSGFKGSIFPVNPNKQNLFGLPTYPSILDITASIDLAVISAPAVTVPNLMQQCATKGVKGAVVISAGFAEAGKEGKILEDRMVAIAREGGIRFVGPNCMGIWSSTAKLSLSFDKAPEPGAIAFVSQSGTFGGYLSEIASSKGYGLSKFISIGNQADITASEYLEYLAEDDDTKVIVFYMEGFKDGRRFFQLARDVIKQKPIIIYKGGSTPAGSRATLSHTASLAGSENVFEAMCRQVGLIRATEAIQSFEMAEALVGEPLPRGNRVAIMGSGGQGVVITDACVSLGLEVPEFDRQTRDDIQKILPAHAPPARNPIDFAGSYRTTLTEVMVIEKLLGLDYIDSIISNVPVNPMIWGLKPGPNGADKETAEIIEASMQASRRFAALPGQFKKPIITIRFRRTDDPTILILKESGIPVYDTPEQAARAMAALVKYAQVRR